MSYFNQYCCAHGEKSSLIQVLHSHSREIIRDIKFNKNFITTLMELVTQIIRVSLSLSKSIFITRSLIKSARRKTSRQASSTPTLRCQSHLSFSTVYSASRRTGCQWNSFCDRSILSAASADSFFEHSGATIYFKVVSSFKKFFKYLKKFYILLFF